jgi:hypothetical protein
VADQSSALPPKLAGRMNTSFLKDDDVLDNKEGVFIAYLHYLFGSYYEMVKPCKTSGGDIAVAKPSKKDGR